MHDDQSLFGDEPREPKRAVPAEAPVADWQVGLLRKALDARGLATMGERRQAIESVAGRSVESLRALTNAEALRVLSRLGESPAKKPTSGSTWDEREEDTWIDRL